MPFHNLTQEVFNLLHSCLLSIQLLYTRRRSQWRQLSTQRRTSQSAWKKLEWQTEERLQSPLLATPLWLTSPFGVGQPGVPVPEQEFGRFAANVLGLLGGIINARRKLLPETPLWVPHHGHGSTPGASGQSWNGTYKEDATGRTWCKDASAKGKVAGRDLGAPTRARLLNLVAQIWETRQLQYIPVEKLATREHEVLLKDLSAAPCGFW